MRLDTIRISLVYDVRETAQSCRDQVVEGSLETVESAFGGDWTVEEVEWCGDDMLEVTVVASGEVVEGLPPVTDPRGAAVSLLEDLGFPVGAPGHTEYLPTVVRHLRRWER